jgi:acetolactate decarboxylase
LIGRQKAFFKHIQLRKLQNMYKKTKILITIFLLLFASLLHSQEIYEKLNNKVEVVSNMKKVMTGQDLSASVKWDTIPREHLFAVSPLDAVAGEVTIIDGAIYTSTVNKKGKVKLARSWGVKSPFAVYAQVSSWEAFETEVNISNEDELQKTIEYIALKNGYNLNEPIPFKIEGNFDEVLYHIISKPKKEKIHNHELHQKAKKFFTLKNTSGVLIGFYSQNHEGIFTHKGQFVHTHFVDDTKQNMGHLDDIKIYQTIKIFLPTL